MRRPPAQPSLFTEDPKREPRPELSVRLAAGDPEHGTPAHDALVAWLVQAEGVKAVQACLPIAVEVPESLQAKVSNFRTRLGVNVELGTVAGFVDVLLREVVTFALNLDPGSRNYEIIRQVAIEVKTGQVALGPTLRQIKAYVTGLTASRMRARLDATARVMTIPVLVHLQEISDRFLDAFVAEGVLCIRATKAGDGFVLTPTRIPLPPNQVEYFYSLGPQPSRRLSGLWYDDSITDRALYPSRGLLWAVEDLNSFLEYIDRFGALNDDPATPLWHVPSTLEGLTPDDVLFVLRRLASPRTHQNLLHCECRIEGNAVQLHYSGKQLYDNALRSREELETMVRLLFGRSATLTLVPAESAWSIVDARNSPPQLAEAHSPLKPAEAEVWRQIRGTVDPQLKAFLMPATPCLDGDHFILRYGASHSFHYAQANRKLHELQGAVAKGFGEDVKVSLQLDE